LASGVLEELVRVAENPKAEVYKWAGRDGRKVIAVLPAYFPEILVHAAGALPVGMWGNTLLPSSSGAYLQSFSCSIARSILELALRPSASVVDGYIFTSMCDNFETLAEVFKVALAEKPVLSFLIPQSSDPASRIRHLESELSKAIAFLEKLTGGEITASAYARSLQIYREFHELVGSFYERRRLCPGSLSNYEFYAVLKASFFMPKERFNEKLRALLAGLPKRKASGPRLLLTGIVPQPLSLLEAFDCAGTLVVTDDFASCRRLFSKDPPEAPAGAELERFLRSGLPCSTLHQEDKPRDKALLGEIERSGAEAVVNWHIKFCEPEAFDRPQLFAALRKASVPVLSFEVETCGFSLDGVRTRLEAFLETISQGGRQSS